jgi:linoleoyl-CoA desaturase
MVYLLEIRTLSHPTGEQFPPPGPHTMQSPRYSSAEIWQKQFATAVRANVNSYFRAKGISTKGDHRMVVKTLVMFGIYLAPFVLILILPFHWLPALLMTVLMGVGVAGIGMAVMHDGLHGSASSRGWLNKLLGGSMYALGGDVLTWKIQHNVLHHTHTNVNEVDHDIRSRGPLRFSEHAPWHWSQRTQHIHAFFFYGLLTLSKLVNDFFMLARFNREGLTQRQGKKPAREFVKLSVIKLLYLGVFIGLPLLLTSFTVWQVLLGFFVIHFVTGVILGSIFQLAHVVEGTAQPLPDGDGVIDSDWAVHELRTTANFARNSRVLNWYIGGLNFQIEHHLFPHICHLHYRAIAPIVERTALEYGLVYNGKASLAAAIGSHVRRLRQLGRS